MTISDIINECVEQCWVPLFVYRNKETSQISLPVFNELSVAKSFMKRNLPKKWSLASFTLCQEDLDLVVAKGWRLHIFDYPNKIVDITDIELGFEILDTKEKPEYMATRL